MRAQTREQRRYDHHNRYVRYNGVFTSCQLSLQDYACCSRCAPFAELPKSIFFNRCEHLLRKQLKQYRQANGVAQWFAFLSCSQSWRRRPRYRRGSARSSVHATQPFVMISANAEMTQRADPRPDADRGAIVGHENVCWAICSVRNPI